MTVRTASAELPGAPGSAAVARAFIVETLGPWECDHIVDTTALLTSELVTNAVLHARTPVSLAVTLDAGRLRVEVCDDSERMPAVRPYSLDDPTGRGLAMVAGFAADWGAERRPGGKCVWFEIDA
jgi:anti-sigma regulatory factor (Ser/Thr protein kinase)